MSAPDYLAQLRFLKKEEINTPSQNCTNPVKDFTQFMQISPSAQKMIFSDEQKVNAWLDHIGAIDPIERQEVIDKCENDPGALAYFLKRYAEDCE